MNAVLLLTLVATIPLMVGAFVIFAEIAAASSSKEKVQGAIPGLRPPVVVLIPAHNESRSILPTLSDVRQQIQRADRLIVVADNCSDDTAAVAKEAGAEVVERNDPLYRGKGYALDFGLRFLQADDPEIVIVIDADCRLQPGAIEQLAFACSQSGRPVQALYLMSAPERTTLNYNAAEFAWRIKNDLRPRGLQALGLPCQLMGSGMALHRKHLHALDLATNHLAEDLDLGLQLAAAGHAPLFCPAAVVSSVFPTTKQASVTQRERWEHGHLAILSSRVLPYSWVALRKGDWDLLALSVDAGVPPLVLFALLTGGAFSASLFLWLAGGSAMALISSLVTVVVFAASLCLAWIARGLDLLTLTGLSSLVSHIAGKLRIYRGAFATDKKWMRTDRPT